MIYFAVRFVKNQNYDSGKAERPCNASGIGLCIDECIGSVLVVVLGPEPGIRSTESDTEDLRTTALSK